MKRRLGRREQGGAPVLFDGNATSVDEDKSWSTGGKLGSGPRVDRVKNDAPSCLVRQSCDTLGDDLRVPAGGGEDLSGLERPSDDAQTRQTANRTGENEGNPYPPALASSHGMFPAALTSKSAVLTTAGTRSCYRNRNAEGLSSRLFFTGTAPRKIPDRS